MARKSRPTFKKRQKEIARQQRQRDKMTRRMAKKEDETLPAPPPGLGAEDPDIAGVRPGPQPLPDEWNYVSNHVPPAAKPEQKAEQKNEPKAEGES